MRKLNFSRPLALLVLSYSPIKNTENRHAEEARHCIAQSVAIDTYTNATLKQFQDDGPPQETTRANDFEPTISRGAFSSVRFDFRRRR